MNKLSQSPLFFILLIICVLSCRSIIGVQTATAIGSAGGSAAGGIIGEATGNASVGAVIGENLGEATGAAINTRMNKQAEEIKKALPQAYVDRNGNGILVEFNNKALFKQNKTTLSTNGQASLDKFITIFNKYPGNHLSISGYSDDKGSAAYKVSVSEKNTVNVSGYLIQKGIDSSSISVKGLGNIIPKSNNDSSKVTLQNRRIAIMISPAIK